MSSTAVPYKKLIREFLLDQKEILGAMVVNTIFVIAFYHLYTDGEVPIIYPLLLTLLVMFFYLAWAAYRYFIYYNRHKTSLNDPHYNEHLPSYEHRRTLESIGQLHRRYLKELNALHRENTMNNRFLYQWVHETKTPVSVISLIIQELQERLPSEQRALRELELQNGKILDNLDKALNTVRLQEFAKDYVPESVSLTDLLKETVNENKQAFIYGRVFPQIKGDGQSHKVLTDRKWCRLILEQLIQNGVKYSTEEGKSKKLYLAIRREGAYTYLDIRDEGIGIPDYDLPKVFEPFFTGENGRAYKNATGMGLYLCKLVADKLEHELKIESVRGEGTKVSVRFRSKIH